MKNVYTHLHPGCDIITESPLEAVFNLPDLKKECNEYLVRINIFAMFRIRFEET